MPGILLGIAAGFAFLGTVPATRAQPKPQSPRILAFYSTDGEGDHTDFALQAVKFFTALAARDHLAFEATTDWDRLNARNLKGCRVVIWLNDSARTPAQRAAFQDYMEKRGAWLGFHFAGYTDSETRWPWYVDFLGGSEYSGNNWPPLPAVLRVEDPGNPLTRHLPGRYLAPANEWYTWTPDLRENGRVRILLSVDPSNFPLGFKETIEAGYVPVAWTNTRYRMIYTSMGHGDRIFDAPAQNRFFEDALLSLASPEPAAGRSD